MIKKCLQGVGRKFQEWKDCDLGGEGKRSGPSRQLFQPSPPPSTPAFLFPHHCLLSLFPFCCSDLESQKTSQPAGPQDLAPHGTGHLVSLHVWGRPWSPIWELRGSPAGVCLEGCRVRTALCFGKLPQSGGSLLIICPIGNGITH